MLQKTGLSQRAVLSMSRHLKRFVRHRQCRNYGICVGVQNTLFRPPFTSESVILDVGCADDADFSVMLMSRFNARCFGVDPTRKHLPALRRLEESSDGKFVAVPFAVCARSGELEFFESEQNVSGSLQRDHGNVLRDSVRSYTVTAVTIDKLLDHLGLTHADMLKLDLEGAEYELLSAVDADTLHRFQQMFVEFHHHCVEQYSASDTRSLVARIETMGFTSFSFDDHNYLFFR